MAYELCCPLLLVTSKIKNLVVTVSRYYSKTEHKIQSCMQPSHLRCNHRVCVDTSRTCGTSAVMMRQGLSNVKIRKKCARHHQEMLITVHHYFAGERVGWDILSADCRWQWCRYCCCRRLQAVFAITRHIHDSSRVAINKGTSDCSASLNAANSRCTQTVRSYNAHGIRNVSTSCKEWQN